MANSRTRKITYTPRHTQMEAYDLLPYNVRAALMEGPQEWDTSSILRSYRKLLKEGLTERNASKLTERMVWGWHREEIKIGSPWRDRRVGQSWQSVRPSPHNEARATMALAYGGRNG